MRNCPLLLSPNAYRALIIIFIIIGICEIIAIIDYFSYDFERKGFAPCHLSSSRYGAVPFHPTFISPQKRNTKKLRSFTVQALIDAIISLIAEYCVSPSYTRYGVNGKGMSSATF